MECPALTSGRARPRNAVVVYLEFLNAEPGLLRAATSSNVLQ